EVLASRLEERPKRKPADPPESVDADAVIRHFSSLFGFANDLAGRGLNCRPRDSEVLIKLLARGRSPKSTHAHENALGPKPFLPSELDRGLHAHAGGGAQNGVLIALTLAREQLPAGHRHHGGCDPLPLQGLGGGGGEQHFGAGAYHGDVAAALW